jgi:beta-1,4-mannooligosaccharide/beta-1,4-mannosyl-N-acetylglucosamine phosphorylase
VSTVKLINAPPLPGMPWEDRPRSGLPHSERAETLWRHSTNPIIKRDATAFSNSVFNSAVVPFKDAFAGVFRIDDTSRRMNIHRGFSADGVDWKIDDAPISFADPSGTLPASDYKYDPRVIFIEDRYYIVWCNGYHGACIGMGYTFDFEEYVRLENPLMPYNRNGVLFPRRIGGNFALLSRPSDSGHTPFGDIFYSESPDLTYWGRHRHVMSPGWSSSGWQSTKVGAGPAPIETSEGWLLFYHGVLTSCNGFVYSFSAALLDLDEPWKVIARAKPYLISPQRDYERSGDVPNVTFPCAALVDGASGRLAIYYGCADTATCLAFGMVDEVVDFVKRNSI